MVERFNTARASAQPIDTGDLDELFELHSDPVVMATLGGRLWDREETRAFLDRMQAHWDRYGYGVWSIRDAATGRFLGRAGLRVKDIDGVSETELLYAYRADAWGHGLGTEVARAIADLAFARLGASSLVAFTLPGNAASRRVMEKADFSYERDFIHAGLPHVLYRRRAPDPGRR